MDSEATPKGMETETEIETRTEKHTWVIRKFSRIPGSCVKAKVPLFGTPWDFACYPKGDYAGGYLTLSFGPSTEVPKEGLKLAYTARWLSQRPGTADCVHRSENTLAAGQTSRLTSVYLQPKDSARAPFISPDDSITLELEVTMFGKAFHNSRPPDGSISKAHLRVLDDLSGMLSSGVCSDVTLRCGDTEFPAHRAILSARSPVFKAMFEHKTAEAEEGVVELEDMEADVAKELLNFLYTGQCQLKRKAAEGKEGKEAKQAARAAVEERDYQWTCKLYAVAHRFQVASLQEVLEEALSASKVTVDTFLDQLLLAERFGISKLKDLLIVMACAFGSNPPDLPKVRRKKRNREAAGLDDEGAEGDAAGLGAALTLDRVCSLRVDQLKRELAARGLSRQGLKADLVLRLENALRGGQ